MNKKLFILSFFVLVLSGSVALCQTANPAVKWSITDFGSHKVFVENKGQFKSLIPNGSNVLYAYDEGLGKIYFTKTGLIYCVTKRTPVEKDDDGKGSGDRDAIKVETKSDVVTMDWLGANTNADIVAEDKVPDYFNYSVKDADGSYKGIDHVNAYKKLTYKNLYPGIDVEFVFHPNNGIEYSLLVHSGADVNKVQMKYSKGHHLFLAQGDVHISTSLGDIIDHAPSSFYTDNKTAIASSFVCNGNVVSFKTGIYDHTQPITVDPWTITPAFPNTNKIWNTQTDGTGNVYLYGGDSPLTLEKYTSTGTLIWTFPTAWDSANYWLGTMITDKAGNSYITSGANGEISKINTGGTQVWHNNPNGTISPLYEYWHESFNCSQTQLIVAGTYLTGGTSGQGAIMNINMASGAISSQVIVGQKSGFIFDEARANCEAPNGIFYFLTLDSIGGVTSTLTPTYKTANSYNISYGSPTYSGQGNMGLNAMRATTNFIYTQNGAHVDKRNIGSLSIIATAAIPGGGNSGGAPENSGIDIDSCGNVYVGSGNQVVEYDANLNKLNSFSTSGAVYDVAVNNNGEVIAVGDKFATSINFSACKPPAPICKPCTNPTITKTITNLKCNGVNSGSAGVSVTNGGGPFYFNWNPSNDTTASATNLAAGIYTVTVSNSGGCSVTDTLIIKQPTAMVVSLTTAAACSGNNGTATASVTGGTGSYTYNWTPSGGTNATATGLAAGSYTVTVTDKNSCTATQIATIASGSGASPTVTMTNTAAACGSCNGTATATPSPAGTYSYSWSNGATTSSISSACAATYTVTVTASSGPTTSTFYKENFTTAGAGWTLNIPGTGTPGTHPNKWVVDNNTQLCNSGNYLHVACTSTNAYYTCNSGATYDPGVATFDNSATDLYASSPNISTVGESGMTLSFTYECDGNSSADYSLVSFSSNGGSTWTDQPTKYSGVTTCTKVSVPIPATYDGISNFRYAFRWINVGKGKGNDPPMAVDSISISGTSSSSGCPAVETVTVPPGGSFSVAVTPVSASCGASNGSATATPSPSGVYTYKWSDGQTTQTASNLAAGSYTVIVFQGSCSDTNKVTVNNTGGPTVSSITRTDELCNGASTGDATANATGGAGGYTYNWSSGQTTSAISNLPAGIYTVTVKDKNGCSITDTVIITQPSAITGSAISITPASCGSSNGSVTVSASGGTGTLTYSWAPSGGTGATANGLSSGSYTCTVTDANHCSKIITVTVTNTGGATVTSTVTDPLCNGGTGTATAHASGGAGSYTYSWNTTPAQTTSVATNLAAGSYTCTVTDKNGCITTDTLTITQPLAITGTTNVTNASCGASDGSVTLNASGGTGGYSYSWNGGQTTSAITNQPAGSYTCTVTDANGCHGVITALISNIGAPSLSITQVNEKCFGDNIGSAIATATGGTGLYTYSWNSGQTTSSISNLGAGTYTCTVTDGNGCQSFDTVDITQPAALASTIAQGNASCGKPGTAAVTAIGGTGPYMYSWNTTPTQTVNPVTGLTSGSYTCTVTDANGCTQQLTATITGNSGPIVSISNDTTIKSGASVTIFASGGGTYVWSPSAGLGCSTCASTTADPEKTTEYCVTVTDTTGCADSACMTITVDLPCGTVFVPNAFSPNGDQENDLECVYGNCITTLDFSIYDRWGNRVFHATDPTDKCWDGKYNGQLMNTGVFVYYLEAILTNGNKVSQKGNITLVR